VTQRIEALAGKIDARFAARLCRVQSLPDELCYKVGAQDLVAVATELRDAPELKFEMLIDVAGVDYLEYGRSEWKTTAATGSGFSRGVERQPGAAPAPAAHGSGRFGVTYQLLSVSLNQRLRLRVSLEDSEDPIVPSVVGVWAVANWFEREAFDLFGILFTGHPDLRRILTDYGFSGHPFRKDFPLIGHVEMRYDETQRRVVYEPVSIEPRVLVPKVIRHDSRYAAPLKGGSSK
jgi:NADH-quinone oxidoreductase subunit C